MQSPSNEHEARSIDPVILSPVFVFATGYLRHRGAAPETLSAGGDVRVAAILSNAPSDGGEVNLVAGKSGLVDLIGKSHSTISVRQIDGAFSVVPKSLWATYVIYFARSLTSYLGTLIQALRVGDPILYSSSNLLPDVISCAMLRRTVRKSRWISVIHHTPSAKQPRDSVRFRDRGTAIWAEALVRIAASTADMVICYNTPVVDLVRYYRPGARILLNGNGIDPDSLKVNRGEEARVESTSAVYVGRLTSRKGINDLALIWSIVDRMRPGSTLSLVGAPAPGGSYEKTRDEFQRLGVSDSVRVLGVLPREAVNVRVASARVMVNASRFEGWSLSIHESLYLRTPVVAWDLPAYRGIYGDCIKTVPEGDYEGFAAAVVSLQDDSAERHSYIQRGFEFAERNTWKSVADREWKAIKSLPSSA